MGAMEVEGVRESTESSFSVHSPPSPFHGSAHGAWLSIVANGIRTAREPGLVDPLSAQILRFRDSQCLRED